MMFVQRLATVVDLWKQQFQHSKNKANSIFRDENPMILYRYVPYNNIYITYIIPKNIQRFNAYFFQEFLIFCVAYAHICLELKLSFIDVQKRVFPRFPKNVFKMNSRMVYSSFCSN